MVDYSAALPQQQFFQAPDMLQNAMRMQQIQAQGAQMQELARQRSEEEASRNITAPLNSPEYFQQLARINPKFAVQAINLNRQNIAADRAAEASTRQAAVSTAELALKNRELIAKHGEEFQRNLRMIDAYPVEQRPEAYGRLVSSLPPDLQTVFPRQYSPDAVRLGMSTTTQLLDAAKPQVQMFGDVPVAVTPETGTFTPLREAGVGAPVGGGAGAPVAGAGAPAVNNALAARAGAPAAGGEAGYLTGLNRAEGTAKNPYSSAEGKFQFIDSTFVDTARKTFPGLADKSPAQILSLRGKKLDNGMQIEDVLEQRLRADNTQALTSAGIAPTPGNTYLAHFLGAGGARSLLSVDPNTPVSQILDPRAIAANKSVLEGKTAGQVAAWADSKFGGSPGLAASMTAGNQRQAGVGAPSFTPAMGGGMSPTAPTMNNAMTLSLMGQQPPQQGNALAMQAAPMAQLQAAPIAAPQPAPALSAFQQAQQDAAQRKLQQRGAEKRQDLEIAQQEKIQTSLPQIEDAASLTLKNIESLIGGAQVDAKGRVVYPEGAKRAHPGFESSVGTSVSKLLMSKPIAGTSRSDFETRFEQVKGGTFLDAYNSLRGGGAIDQKEGEKATAALNRMNLAQSEAEFIRAARDFEDVVKKGVARARTMAQGGAGSNMTSAATAAATAPQAKPAERQVKRSGMYNGRRVVEYSDGATEYAD